MTQFQKTIKYIALALAILLIIGIFAGAVNVVAALISILEDPDDIIGDMTAYNVSQDITELEIEVGASELIIQAGDALSVQSNHKYLKVEERGERLIITEKSGIRLNHSSDVQLLITIPAGLVFKNADITAGAGRVSVDRLDTQTLDLELGAGEAVIKKLNVLGKADIDGGTGKINIESGSICNLDLKMGVGELRLSCALEGKNELDCSVGATRLTLPGTLEEYRFDIEKGLGNISLDGRSVSNGLYGSGNINIDIDGGIGSIDIDFIQ
ncbi:MAG: DUF4097 family beta strand repeat protein [Clostridia bacterium]|nr:DUF4097 family beta strand repeat protein [Clostridia bacterium]